MIKTLCVSFLISFICADNAYPGQIKGGGIITPKDAVNAFQAFFWTPEAQVRKVKIAVKVKLHDGRITYINKENLDETCIDKNNSNPDTDPDSIVPVLRSSCVNN